MVFAAESTTTEIRFEIYDPERRDAPSLAGLRPRDEGFPIRRDRILPGRLGEGVRGVPWPLALARARRAGAGRGALRLLERARLRGRSPPRIGPQRRPQFLGPDEIGLDYSVETTDARGHARAPGRRAAIIPRAALTTIAETPVDAVAVERIDPVARRAPGSGRLRAGRVVVLAAVDEEFVEVIVAAGRQRGFRLCRDGACGGLFRSQILYRDRTAWWVYPLLPFSGALDIALTPLQVISVSPFFLVGD